MFNVCGVCGKSLRGLSFGYGKAWTCSNCIDDKSDILHCEEDCKVKLKTLQAGYEDEQEEAKKLFNFNDTYTTKSVDVGRSSSKIELKEFPNKYFNTVFFERVE